MSSCLACDTNIFFLIRSGFFIEGNFLQYSKEPDRIRSDQSYRILDDELRLRQSFVRTAFVAFEKRGVVCFECASWPSVQWHLMIDLLVGVVGACACRYFNRFILRVVVGGGGGGGGGACFFFFNNNKKFHRLFFSSETSIVKFGLTSVIFLPLIYLFIYLFKMYIFFSC